jgi:hypothetical protein
MRTSHFSRAIEAEIASIASIIEEVGARKDRGDACVDFMVDYVAIYGFSLGQAN